MLVFYYILFNIILSYQSMERVRAECDNTGRGRNRARQKKEAVSKVILSSLFLFSVFRVGLFTNALYKKCCLAVC
jgi:hypothetical protein